VFRFSFRPCRSPERQRKEKARKGKEEGFAAGIISICREMLHLEDREVIEMLMEKMNLPREKAAEYLAGCGGPDT